MENTPGRFLHRRVPTIGAASAVLVAAVLGGCERSANPPPPSVEAPLAQTRSEPPPAKIFPALLRVEDTSVNAFVEHAMQTAIDGDYNAFRLLWTSKHDPLSREQFTEGWAAVSTIELRRLEKIKLEGWPPAGTGVEENAATSDPTVAYVLAADVNLDPQHKAARLEPSRRVLLMLVPDEGGWRLAHPPDVVRRWATEAAEPQTAADAAPQPRIG